MRFSRIHLMKRSPPFCLRLRSTWFYFQQLWRDKFKPFVGHRKCGFQALACSSYHEWCGDFSSFCSAGLGYRLLSCIHLRTLDARESLDTSASRHHATSIRDTYFLSKQTGESPSRSRLLSHPQIEPVANSKPTPLDLENLRSKEFFPAAKIIDPMLIIFSNLIWCLQLFNFSEPREATRSAQGIVSNNTRFLIAIKNPPGQRSVESNKSGLILAEK